MAPQKIYKRLLLREIYSRELSLDEARKHLNLNDFKSLRSPDEQTRYLATHGTLLGAGSSRRVYLISSSRVLKMAQRGADNSFYSERYELGRAQNEAEVELFTNPSVKPFLAKIYDFDPSYTWLISELVRPLKNTREFTELTGVEWRDFVTLCDSGREQASRHKEEVNGLVNEKYKDNKFVQNFMELITKTDIDPYDFQGTNQLGKTNDGRLVLLDYGFSKSVVSRYY